MLRLLLLRHAKSSWAESGAADVDRPLAPRGRGAAERMAVELAREEYRPDRVLCSPARRTRETLAFVLPNLTDMNRVSITDELYEPAQGDYRDVIAAFGGDARRLLVIGHNPSIQITALRLVGSADAQTADRLAAKFPTAALAAIDFDFRSWRQLRPGSGRLIAFLRPKDLGDKKQNVQS
jgi:phosphohistidine phosphatase